MKRYLSDYRTLMLAFALVAAMGMSTSDALCQRIYSWTDKDGTLHITDQPPPDSADSVNVYKIVTTPQQQQEDKTPEDLEAVKAIQDYERLEEERAAAAEQAVKARKKAIEARRKANIAVAEADRIKAETKELAKKTTKRKQERLELDRQKQHEIKTISLAQEAVALAQEAEDMARLAEAEAERLRQLTLEPPPKSPASETPKE